MILGITAGGFTVDENPVAATLIGSGTFNTANATQQTPVDIGSEEGGYRYFICHVVYWRTFHSGGGGGGTPLLDGQPFQGRLYSQSNTDHHSWVGILRLPTGVGSKIFQINTGNVTNCTWRLFRVDAGILKNSYDRGVEGLEGFSMAFEVEVGDKLILGGEAGSEYSNIFTEIPTIIDSFDYQYLAASLRTNRGQTSELVPSGAGSQSVTIPTHTTAAMKYARGFHFVRADKPLPSQVELTEVPVFRKEHGGGSGGDFYVNVGEPDPGRYFVVVGLNTRNVASGCAGGIYYTLNGQSFTAQAIGNGCRFNLQVGYLYLPTGSGEMVFNAGANANGDGYFRLFKISNGVFRQHTTTSAAQTAALALQQNTDSGDLLVGVGSRDAGASATDLTVFETDPVSLGDPIETGQSGVPVLVNSAKKRAAAAGLDGFTIKESSGAIFKALQLLRFGTHTASAADTPHRYWRLYIESVFGGSDYSLGELKLMNSPTGAQLATGGTAFADSQLNASYAPANAFNGNGGTTFWHSVTGPAPHWIGYDFGVGNAVAVNAVQLTARSDNGTYAQNTSPSSAFMEWSDDGVMWTRDFRVHIEPWTGAGQVQSVSLRPPASPPVSSTKWRIFIDQNNGGQLCGFGDMAWFDETSTNINSSGTPTTQSAYTASYGAANGVDGVLTSWCLSAINYPARNGWWLQMQWASPKTISKIIMNRGTVDIAGYLPKDFVIQAMDSDGLWKDVLQINNQTAWALNEARTFTI